MGKNNWNLPSEKILPQGEVVQKVEAMIVVDALSRCEEDLRSALDLLDEIAKGGFQQGAGEKIDGFLSKFK